MFSLELCSLYATVFGRPLTSLSGGEYCTVITLFNNLPLTIKSLNHDIKIFIRRLYVNSLLLLWK
jgi:hypothetical protein